MENLFQEADQSEIIHQNNFQFQTQNKSSIFQSKLQQSIQNIKQLTKPIALHIEPRIQPLQKPEFQQTIKQFQNYQQNSNEYSILTKRPYVNNHFDQTKNLDQNQFNINQSHRKKESQIIKSTDYSNIFQIYHHSSIVEKINSYEECFQLLIESKEAQLLRIPTNLILEILREREELQHECITLGRKLYQIERLNEQSINSEYQNE